MIFSKKKILGLCVSAAVAVMSCSAFAASMSIPDDGAIATIDSPAGWTSDKTDKGIMLNSPDASTLVVVEKLKTSEIAGEIQQIVQGFASVNFTIDPASKTVSDIDIKGLKMHNVAYKATTAAMPMTFEIGVIESKTPDYNLVLFKVGSDDGDKANGAALNALLGSISLR